MNKGKKIIELIILLIIVGVLVFIDQLTKVLAVDTLKGKDPFVLLPGVLELRYLENQGAAFGMFQNGQLFFAIIALLCVVFILVFLYRLPMGKKMIPMKICMAMIMAGAIGNLIDRCTLNYVRDFIYFSLIDFPIFNAADIYVSVFTVLLAILIIFFYKNEDFGTK